MSSKLSIVAAGLAAIVAGLFFLFGGPLTSINAEVEEQRSVVDERLAARKQAGVPKLEMVRTVVSPPDAPDYSGQLVVTVLDLDAKPIAGARVFGDDAKGVTTDAAGQVVIERAPRILRVSHADYAPAAEWLVDEQIEDQTHEVRLGVAAALTCRVVNELGQPVADAEVTVACGGVDRGVSTQTQSQRWQESILPVTDGGVVYARTLRSDARGSVAFSGLSLGAHEVWAASDGYIAQSTYGAEWTRAVDVVTLQAGANTAELQMQSLCVQVAIIRNETGLPQDVFDSLLKISGGYHFTVTDLLPSMYLAGEAAEKRIRDQLRSGSGRERIHVGVGRARMPLAQDAATDASIEFHGKFADRIRARWVRLADFQVGDAEELVISDEVPTGTLAIDVPYAVKASPLYAGYGRRYGIVFHPGEPAQAVPAGEYLVAPLSDYMLWDPTRAQRISIAVDEAKVVDMSSVPPVSTLQVSVKDAAGNPSDRCAVMVRGATQYRSVRPVNGVVKLLCEPGSYEVKVRNLALTIVLDDEVEVAAGSGLTMEVVLPR